MSSAHVEDSKSRFRFSLRTLTLLTLVLCVVFGAIGLIAHEANRQRKVVADLEAIGAAFRFKEKESSTPEMLDTGYADRVVVIALPFSEEVEDVAFLCEFRNVEHITLASTGVDDLSPISMLNNVLELNVDDTKTGDLSPLAKMTTLQRLDVSHTAVDDIAPLAELRDLEFLDLGSTHVADLSPLTNLQELEMLILHNTPIDDVSPLTQLKSLRMLLLTETQITTEQVNELQQELPDCQILR